MRVGFVISEDDTCALLPGESEMEESRQTPYTTVLVLARVQGSGGISN